MDDDAISRMEIGQDIKNFPKCNTSNGSGTQELFTENTLPGISSRFTIAGTASSGIRSMWTGSDQTRTCQSRYGIQDIVGNVDEKLSLTASNLGVANSWDFSAARKQSNVQLSFVFTDAGDLGELHNIFIYESNIGDEYNSQIEAKHEGMEFINIPLATPVGNDVKDNWVGDDAYLDYIFDIRNNSGMTNRQLHDDVWDINFAGEPGFFSYGGSYKSNGNAAGIYTLKGRPYVSSLVTEIDNEVTTFPDPEDFNDKGGRCVHRIPNSFYIEESL